VTAEQRKSNRKIYKAKVQLALGGKPAVAGRTMDIGADGISASFPDPVEAGQAGHVRFDLLVDGRPNTITTACRIVYCIFSRGEFRVGIGFTALDPAANSLVTRFLR
jgi:hypothetical protein